MTAASPLSLPPSLLFVPLSSVSVAGEESEEVGPQCSFTMVEHTGLGQTPLRPPAFLRPFLAACLSSKHVATLIPLDYVHFEIGVF